MSNNIITGIKHDIIEKYHLDSLKKHDYKTLLTNNEGITSMSSNSDQSRNLFSDNSKLLLDSTVTNDYYRICNQCGKPIFLSVMMEHLNNHCEKALPSPSFSSSTTTESGNNEEIIGTKRRLSTSDIDDDDNDDDTNSRNHDEDNNHHKRLRSVTSKKKPPPSIKDDDEEEEEDNEKNNKKENGDDEDEDVDEDDDDEEDADIDTDTRLSSTTTWGTSNTGTPIPSDLKKAGNTLDDLNDSTSSLKKNSNSDSNTITSKPIKKNTKVKKERRIKQRNPTEKHLIDFDKQCGVELPEGGYCARSLTCKSHSMGSKRSVEGRSKPFDELLADYHREHQTKIGAANERRAKQQELQRLQRQMIKEQKEQKRLLQKAQNQAKRANSNPKQSRNGSKSNNERYNSINSSNKNNVSANNGDNNNNNSRTLQNGSTSKQISSNGNIINDQTSMITSEEETTHVLNGISRSFPLPLESTILSTTRFRTKYFRMREMFASSFNVKPNYTSPGYGAIHSRVGCLDIDRTTDYKFRIRTPQLQLQSNIMNNNGNNINNNIQFNGNNIVNGNINVSNLTPKQLQKLQLRQQKLLQLQRQRMLAQQNRVQQQQQSSPVATSNQANSFTPQDIQIRQQTLRKQQLQHQKFEATSSLLPNKSIQSPNGFSNVSIQGTSSGTPVNLSATINSPINTNLQTNSPINIGNSPSNKDNTVNESAGNEI